MENKNFQNQAHTLTYQDLLDAMQEMENWKIESWLPSPVNAFPTSREFIKKYTSFAPVDIKDITDSIGAVDSIKYSISRYLETHIYEMEDFDPLSFSRGKRGIAGTVTSLMLEENVFFSQFREPSLPHRTTIEIKSAGTEPIYTETYLRKIHIDDSDPDSTCHCGIPWKQHSWEDHSFIELEEPKKHKLKSKCDVCDEMFPTAGELRIHRQEIHGWIRGRQPPGKHV